MPRKKADDALESVTPAEAEAIEAITEIAEAAIEQIAELAEPTTAELVAAHLAQAAAATEPAPEPTPEIVEGDAPAKQVVTYRARDQKERAFDWCGYSYYWDGHRVPHWDVPVEEAAEVEKHMFFLNGRIVRA